MIINKKKIFVFSLFILLLSLFMISPVRADSGWSSSYGGGGHHSSGGYHSSRGSSSSGGGSLPSLLQGDKEFDSVAIIYALMFSVVFTVGAFENIFYPYFIKFYKDKAKLLSYLFSGVFEILSFLLILIFGDLYLAAIFFFMLIVFVVFDLNSYYKTAYRDVSLSSVINYGITDINSLKKELYKDFCEIEIAWMNFNYDSLRDLCSDELYNTYKTDLEVLKLKFGQNIMSDFTSKDCRIYKVREVNGLLEIKMYLRVTFYDYVIDTRSRKIIRGTAQSPLTNEYLLTFVRSSSVSNEVICSNCGAKVTFNTSGKCSYCNSDLIKPSGKYILIEKKNINN